MAPPLQRGIPGLVEGAPPASLSLITSNWAPRQVKTRPLGQYGVEPWMELQLQNYMDRRKAMPQSDSEEFLYGRSIRKPDSWNGWLNPRFSQFGVSTMTPGMPDSRAPRGKPIDRPGVMFELQQQLAKAKRGRWEAGKRLEETFKKFQDADNAETMKGNFNMMDVFHGQGGYNIRPLRKVHPDMESAFYPDGFQ